jgi:uncharacterized surface protein with fasciclin (FAS1) repeats
MKKSGWLASILVCCGILIGTSCETELGETYKDPTKEQVYSYLKIEENQDEFSILVDAMDRSGLAGMLNSYGTYTLFAPSNTGFESYFNDLGIGGLDDLDSASIHELLVYHILNKERLTSDMSPGFSSDTTAAGDYLVYDMSQGDGAIHVNTKSRIHKVDRRVSNGVVHHVEEVLIPPNFTIWKYLSEDNSYSLFTAALEKTGYKEEADLVDLKKGKLNTTFTFYAETDEVFAAEGIQSLKDLENKLAQRESDLDEFMAYHIIKGKKLKGALFTFMIQNEGLVTLSGKSINANIDQGLVFNQWWEPDGTYHAVTLEEEDSDIFARNGVLHTTQQVMFIPEDLELEPIIRECENGIVYNEITEKYEVDEDSLASWTPGTEVYLESSDTLLRYDAIQKSNYIAFKMENLIPGRYNIILGYEANSAFAKVQLYIDGSPLGEEIDLTEDTSSGEVKIGERAFQVVGDHEFRFVHLTNGDGLYNYIKLDPISD